MENPQLVAFTGLKFRTGFITEEPRHLQVLRVPAPTLHMSPLISARPVGKEGLITPPNSDSLIKP